MIGMEDAEIVQDATIHNYSNAELQFSQTYNVRIPKAEAKIILDESSVKKIQDECEKAKKTSFPYGEVLLGVSSLLIGAFFSAILSKVPYELKLISVFFYSICPVCGIGCGVGYFFHRKKDTYDIKQFAEKIEECIKNIDNVAGRDKEWT